MASVRLSSAPGRLLLRANAREIRKYAGKIGPGLETSGKALPFDQPHALWKGREAMCKGRQILGMHRPVVHFQLERERVPLQSVGGEHLGLVAVPNRHYEGVPFAEYLEMRVMRRRYTRVGLCWGAGVLLSPLHATHHKWSGRPSSEGASHREIWRERRHNSGSIGGIGGV